MKNDFGRSAAETYASQQQAEQERIQALEQHAKAIEDKLKQPPQIEAPALRPTGLMRAYGDQMGREALREQGMDIQAELERIKEERLAREQDNQIDQNKGKSL